MNERGFFHGWLLVNGLGRVVAACCVKDIADLLSTACMHLVSINGIALYES